MNCLFVTSVGQRKNCESSTGIQPMTPLVGRFKLTEEQRALGEISHLTGFKSDKLPTHCKRSNVESNLYST